MLPALKSCLFHITLYLIHLYQIFCTTSSALSIGVRVDMVDIVTHIKFCDSHYEGFGILTFTMDLSCC